MKNIHTLPTNKPSRLQKNKHNKLFLSEENKSYSDCIIQNIHITNDEEIKEGDYGILGKEVLSYHQMHKRWGMPQGKKIILTTDADLVKDGVQAIDDEFLEWFVKNPSCEWVEIEKMFNVVQFTSREFIYKIIIPKEKYCEHFTPTIGCIKDICSCNKDPKQAPFKHKIKSLSTEEVLANRSNAYEFIDFDKQETLEEAADRYFPFAEKIGGETYTAYRGFKAGAKWQQERMYSEEIVDILDNVRYWETCPNSYKVIIERFIEQTIKTNKI